MCGIILLGGFRSDTSDKVSIRQDGKDGKNLQSDFLRERWQRQIKCDTKTVIKASGA